MIREGFVICGPYKGFYGRAEYDPEASQFHGQIIGTRDVITFQGKSTTELEASFPESIDDYLSFCEARGESPEKPYSGKFMVRLDPELHRQASAIATQSGVSLNQFVAECIGARCGRAVVAELPAPMAKPASDLVAWPPGAAEVMGHEAVE